MEVGHFSDRGDGCRWFVASQQARVRQAQFKIEMEKTQRVLAKGRAEQGRREYGLEDRRRRHHLRSSTPLKFHAPDFDFDAPTTMATVLPTFGSSGTDLKFVAKYYPHIDGGLPAANLAHKIASSAGDNMDGKSDAAGKSSLLKSDAMHIASIDIRDEAQDK